MAIKNAYLQKVYDKVVARDPDQALFHQAVREFLESLDPVLEQDKSWETNGVIDRLVEPERVITFRVPWLDDKGNVQVNRGYRVQFNSAIGPYKGGIRLRNEVTLSMLLPLGSKSEPPLPPPMGSVVRLFLKICSKPRNFSMESVTSLRRRIPPLYGPIAELNCTR